jgi:hypothetical protein
VRLGFARLMGLHLFAPSWPLAAVSPAAGARHPAASVLLCVYRVRNEPTVSRLVAQARDAGMEVALWALDRPIPGLASFTLGAGAGMRLDLLNRLWAAASRSTYRHVVIADDDVIVAGSIGQILAATDRCGFGLAQPAHCWSSRYSYGITRRRRLTWARHTTFVEPGPLFVVSTPWIPHVLPFPENFGMGYGLWLLWQDLQGQGCRMGIIDGVAVKHLAAIAADYDPMPERERLRLLLRARGFSHQREAQRTLGAWRVWEAEPSWIVADR